MRSNVVELREVSSVVDRVRGVRVGHEVDVRSERVAHRAHVLDVLSRLDLELDLAIARRDGGDGAFDERGPAPTGCRARCRSGRGRACRRAVAESGTPLDSAASPHSPSRARPSPCCGRECRGRACRGRPRDAASGRPSDPRREPFADREPRGVDRLGRVVRQLEGDALRPRRRAVVVARARAAECGASTSTPDEMRNGSLSASRISRRVTRPMRSIQRGGGAGLGRRER